MFWLIFTQFGEGLVSHFWSFVLVRKTFFNVPQSLRLVWQDEEWFYCQWFFLSSLSTNQAHGWMFEHIQLHYKSMCEILGQSKNSSDAKHGIKIGKLSYSLKISKCCLKNEIVLTNQIDVNKGKNKCYFMNRITSYICSFVYCDVSEFLKSLQG